MKNTTVKKIAAAALIGMMASGGLTACEHINKEAGEERHSCKGHKCKGNSCSGK